MKAAGAPGAGLGRRRAINAPHAALAACGAGPLLRPARKPGGRCRRPAVNPRTRLGAGDLPAFEVVRNG